MNKQKSQSGSVHLIIIIVLVLSLLGTLGVIYWQNYMKPKQTNANNTDTTNISTQNSNTDQLKTKTMATWSEFSEMTIGLKFSYPSEWGQAKFEIMNSIPDDLNPTFYKISFDKQTYATIMITPKSSLKDYSNTFNNIKTSILSYPDSRHVFINEATVVGTIVPSIGNQDSEIYAARLINLPKVDASDVILTDAREYSGSCSQSSYISCYTDSELNAFQWVLENLTSQ